MNQLKDNERELLPIDNEGYKPGLCKRHILAILGFFGFFNVYALRVNMNVAVVAMVNDTGLVKKNISGECPPLSDGNSTVHGKEGEFHWDQDTQGLVLGSFFYGYIVTQLPGGWLAEMFGGHKLFGVGVLTTAVFTLLTPVAARFNVYVLVATRIIEGLGEAVTFPAMHVLLAKWSPPKERSRLLAFTYSGVHAGTLFSMPISGLLCEYGFDGGWPSVFYIFGAVGCLWYLFWWYFIYGSPDSHPTISQEERQYITTSIGDTHKKRSDVRTPWSSIFTSVPFWALACTHFCNNWGFYTLLTEIPNYLKSVLRFNISEDGFLSALPYVVCWVVMTAAAVLADTCIKRHWISTKYVRKIWNTLGEAGPGLCLAGVALVGCDHVAAVALLTAAVGLNGFIFSGFALNHIELAPQFAGTLLGITNCFATIPGFLSPQIIGWMTQNDPNHQKHEWAHAFYLAASVYGLGALIFVLFGSSERQPWADLMTSSTEEDSAGIINDDDDDINHDIIT